MNRREYLSLFGAAGVAAGCLGDGTGMPADSGSTAPRSETRTGSAPATHTATSTPALAPPDAETPAPGECDAPSPPQPSTGDGLPDARSYPERPARIEVAPVKTFVEEFEAAYLYNRRLAEVAAEDNCLEYLDTFVTESTVRRVEGGVVAEVVTRGSYTGMPCPGTTGTDTATPLPHADFFSQSARYYVTDRFTVRNGAVVECRE